ncbi:MAG TPA: type II toxin-antitoxin system prevent-host-death family antitoxin [Terriglobia bacterium]|jgi:prevent-host-death family protein
MRNPAARRRGAARESLPHKNPDESYDYQSQRGGFLPIARGDGVTIVVDHGGWYAGCEAEPMEQIAISKFKATCLEVLERVKRTRKPILVTRFGQPIAEVTPPSFSSSKGRKPGSMTGTIKIKGDIISPASSTGDWEVLKK